MVTNPTDKQPFGTGVVILRIRRDGAAPTREADHGDQPVVLARLPDLQYFPMDSPAAPRPRREIEAEPEPRRQIEAEPQTRFDFEAKPQRDAASVELSRPTDAPAPEERQHAPGADHGRRRRVPPAAMRASRSWFYQLGVTVLGVSLLVLVLLGLTLRHADEATEQLNAAWPESRVATGAPEEPQISQGELVQTEPIEGNENHVPVPSRTWVAGKADVTGASDDGADATSGAEAPPINLLNDSAEDPDLLNDSAEDPDPRSSASTAQPTRRDTWMPREKESVGPPAGQLDSSGSVVQPRNESVTTTYTPPRRAGTSGSVVDERNESAPTTYTPARRAGTSGSVVDERSESAATTYNPPRRAGISGSVVGERSESAVTPALPNAPGMPVDAQNQEVGAPLPELYGPRRQLGTPDIGGPSASDGPSMDPFPSAHVYPATDYADTYPDLPRGAAYPSEPGGPVRTAQRLGAAADYPSTNSKPVVGVRAPVHLEQRIEPLPTQSHERHE